MEYIIAFNLRVFNLLVSAGNILRDQVAQIQNEYRDLRKAKDEVRLPATPHTSGIVPRNRWYVQLLYNRFHSPQKY